MTLRLLNRLFRFLASLKLAIASLLTLATVLACATILETDHGAAYSRWFVYETSWFVGLLALLGINIFCAAAIRIPWKRHQIGFVVTHCGLLLLLVGSVRTFLGGIEGRVSLAEGQTADSMVLSHRSRITAYWVGRPDEPPFEFTFDGGPVDWSASKRLDIGEVDGVRARILGYCPCGHPVEDWEPDENGRGNAVVKFRVLKDGITVAESWLMDEQFGEGYMIGPLKLQLERAFSNQILKHFLEPSDEELSGNGTLVMIYNDLVQCVPVDGNIGKAIPLGETGAVTEITKYLPNAIPDKLGNFTSKNDDPKNPMVELRVRVAGQSEPLRQIAFAKNPLLNLDAVYSRDCPVKFRFEHPAIKPQAGCELLQTSDGKLYGRLCVDGGYEARGELKPGDRISLPGRFQLEIIRHLPHALRRVGFVPHDPPLTGKAREKSEPAALVEITVGGVAQQVWMRRADPEYGQQTITTTQGPMVVQYDYGRLPLGFSLGLIDFQRGQNPGNIGNATYSSRVRLVDPQPGTEMEFTVSMNEPLTHKKFTFYQSSFDEPAAGQKTSTFAVARDPGRFLKYLGCLMSCVGIATMFYMRAYFFKGRQHSSSNPFDNAPGAREDQDRSCAELGSAA